MAAAPASPAESASGPRRAAPIPAAGGSSAGGITIEWLVEEWPKIRADVKAVDRRVEALLSQADPHAIVDDLAVLTAPYQFHRDQLNKDDKRLVVEDVLSRRAGRPYRITCIDRNEGLASIGGGRASAVEVSPGSVGAAAPTATSGLTPEVASIAPSEPTAPAIEQPEAVGATGGPAALSPDEQRLRAATSIFDADIVDRADE